MTDATSASRVAALAVLSLLSCQRFVDGPGVAPCFPGEGLPPVEGASLAVASHATLWVLRLGPAPTLELVPLEFPVRPLGIASATADGVIATRSDGGTTELLEVRLIPTPAVRVLASEPGTSPWWGRAVPSLDGASFLVTRRDRASGRPVRLERRDLASGSVLAEATLPDGVEDTPAVSGDGQRIFLTRPWASNALEAQLCTLEAQTLSGLACHSSTVAISVRPSPDGRWLYSPLNWQGLVSLDARTLEPIGYAESFSNPTATGFTADSRFLMVTHQSGAGVLAVYDTATDQRCNSVNTGLTPVRLALLGGGRVAVTGDFGARGLTVIDTQTMEVTARLAVGEPVDLLVPLVPPARSNVPERGPVLKLKRAPPEAEVEFIAGDAPGGVRSARAFIGERELSSLIRVEGTTLRLALGPCDRYPGANRITLSARDSVGRVAKLLLEFEERGEEEEPLVSGRVVVTFDENVTALEPAMRQCAKELGAIISPASPSGDRLGEYRVPSCVSVWDAAKRLRACPGVKSALPDWFLTDR